MQIFIDSYKTAGLVMIFFAFSLWIINERWMKYSTCEMFTIPYYLTIIRRQRRVNIGEQELKNLTYMCCFANVLR